MALVFFVDQYFDSDMPSAYWIKSLLGDHLIPLTGEIASAGTACFRVAIGGVPRFAVESLNGSQFFLSQRLIQRGQFLRHKAVEFFLHVLELFLQRIDARRLVIRRPPLV